MNVLNILNSVLVFCMKQTTTKEKLESNKIITDSKMVMLLKDKIRPMLSLIASTRVPYKVVIEKSGQPLFERSVIYVANHSCFADTPIMGRIVPNRSYILLGKQRLGFSDWLYFILNGVIFVDRKEKEDKAASKQAMITYLERGRSVVIFPEGTWNLTENQLMLPMKWGIIDVARKTGSEVVPVNLEYDRERKKCYVRFGESITFTSEENKEESISILRDTMATMRWEAWERNGIFSRAELDMELERQKLLYSVMEYPPIDWEYECSCIYHLYAEPAEVFDYLDKLIPHRENAFLFRK